MGTHTKETVEPQATARLAPQSLWSALGSLELPRHAVSWRRPFGVLSLVLLGLLFLTGAALTLYYTPAPGSAYDSVDFVQFNVPFGGVIRGVHHYSWNLLLIVLALHLMTEFIAAAYKSNGRLIWISGVVAAMLIPLFIVTGDLLPWDQRAYWSTQIRSSILGSVPWIGDFLVRVLQGGSGIGVVALTRFYILHIFFLPCALMAALALHSSLVVDHWRSKPSSDELDARSTMRLYPGAVHRWLVLFIVVAVVLGVTAWLRPALLEVPADPADASYVPRPEWWVLFLNQIVTHCKGPLAVVGSTLVPVGLVAFLIALPVSRSWAGTPSEQAPRYPDRRGADPGAVIGLSIAGYFEHYAGSTKSPG